LITEYSILKNIQIRQLFSVDCKIREDANKKEWVAKINGRLADFLTSKDFKPTNDTLVEELSGGQRQLLNVLIALEFEHSSEIGCRLLMLDEHLTSLDVIIQRKVMELITKIVSLMSFKPTILMITHDFQYALEFSDEICIVKEGEIKEVIVRDNKSKWKIEYLIKSIE
jgi:ABC-type dipeptide/oligopeptide/nickel transport system ATPase subunit